MNVSGLTTNLVCVGRTNMTKSYLSRQLFVVASSQLAALAVGAAVTLPSILLQQLNSKESSIHMELGTISWIGSIHGLAGIPSIVMPTIMQWKGRKLAFLLACLVSIIGWIIAVAATDSTTILISESFHGFGNNSLLAVSLLSISEMVAPQFRNVAMISFHMVQSFGMAMVSVLGRFLHWKTVSMIMCVPMLISFLMALLWPESPSWLAYKGKYEKCEQAFVWLRGTDEYSKRELEELIRAQKEKSMKHQTGLRSMSVLRRDFYLPTIHMFMLLCLMYWSGCIVILIYYAQMIKSATRNENAAFYGGILINVILFTCTVISTFLVRRFNNKSVLLSSTVCQVVALSCTSLVSYLQDLEIITKDSLICLYFLVVYMFASSLGVIPVVFILAAELMPVKHRGLGGAMFIIFTCVLHASSLKAAPYLFLYINLYGTLLVFACNSLVCGLYIWKYVPETKCRTIQELEKFYVRGKFEKILYNEEINYETKEQCLQNASLELHE